MREVKWYELTPGRIGILIGIAALAVWFLGGLVVWFLTGSHDCIFIYVIVTFFFSMVAILWLSAGTIR